MPSLVCSVLAITTLAGCALGPKNSARATGKEALPGVDPTRAYLSLAEIEPRIEPPPETVGGKEPSPRAARQIAKAGRFTDEERYTEASLALERALRYDPDHPAIHRALADLHWRAGNIERARTHARSALKGDPNDLAAQAILGRCASAQGDYPAAIAAYRTALLCRVADGESSVACVCRFELAESLSAEGYLSAALSQYDAFERCASELSGQGEAGAALLAARRTRLADAKSSILERLARYAEAAGSLEPVALEAPGDVARSVRCARLWMRANKLDRALAVAQAITSDEDEVLQLLATIHEKAGTPEAIVDDLRARLTLRPDETRLARHLADALDRLGRGTEARTVLLEFLGLHPDAEPLRLRLVDLLASDSRWDEALLQCAEGIRRAPDQVISYEAKVGELVRADGAADHFLKSPAPQDDHVLTYLLGLAAAEVGRDARAVALWQRVYNADRSFVPARVALAEHHLQAYRYDEALSVAARLDPDVVEGFRLEMLLGRIHERLDDPQQAELHFKAALQLDRHDADAVFALTKVLEQAGKTNRARLRLSTLLDEKPSHDAAREMLAFMLLADGKIDAAMTQFRELRDRAKTAGTSARCDALLALVDDHDPDAYRRAVVESMAQGDTDFGVWLEVVGGYDLTQQRSIRDAYVAALSREPANEDAAVGLVWIEQELLEFEVAVEHLSKLLPRRPNRHRWRYQLIDLYDIVQDFEAGLALARREEARSDLAPESKRRYRARIIRLLRKLGRDGEILGALRRWADEDSDNAAAAAQFAEELINQDRAEEAVSIYERLHRLNPPDDGILGSLIGALAAAGHGVRAEQFALDRLLHDPESDTGLHFLVAVLADADRVDAAIELIQNKLLRTGNRERFQNLAADILRGAKRYEECTAWLDGLIDEAMGIVHGGADRRQQNETRESADEQRSLRPDEPYTSSALRDRLDTLHLQVAGTLIQARQYEEAEERAKEWLGSPRDTPIALNFMMLLAAAQQLQGEIEEAAETSEHALMAWPDHIQLNNDVAYGWIDRGVRLTEAERMIRLALASSPTQAAYLDTYGWLLYKRGDFAGARKWLTRANGAMPEGDPVIFDHLGDACWRVGQEEQAVEHWKAAVEAVEKKEEEELTQDQNRVLRQTRGKIEAARAGETPGTAAASVE